MSFVDVKGFVNNPNQWYFDKLMSIICHSVFRQMPTLTGYITHPLSQNLKTKLRKFCANHY